MRAFLRAVFLENLWLKLLSLALSGVLFLYVQGERRRDAFTDTLVRLTLQPPSGKVLTTDPVEKLAVRLHGARGDIQRLNQEGIPPITVDLQGRAPGALRFTREMLRLPGSVQVESIGPPEIDVAWDDLASKIVPLRPRYAGQPAAGYRVVKATVTPAQVQLQGARSIVQRINELELAEARVDGRSEDVELSVPVQLRHKYVRATPDAAVVRVEIGADTLTKRYPGVPVELQNRPAGLEVEVSPTSALQVLVEGPSPALARVDAGALRVVIDLRDVMKRPGVYLRTPRLEGAPPGVRLLSTTPPAFSVQLKGRTAPDEAP